MNGLRYEAVVHPSWVYAAGGASGRKAVEQVVTSTLPSHPHLILQGKAETGTQVFKKIS